MTHEPSVYSYERCLRMLPQPAPVKPRVTKPALVNRQVNMLGDIWQVEAVEDVGGWAMHQDEDD